MRAQDLGEDAVVTRIVDSYPQAPAWLRIGPGDDAAVLALGAAAAEGLVASTDTLVQDYDFRLDWSNGFDIGVKLAAQNFADIAAMGAQPKALLVSLAAPATLPVGFADDLAAGLADECNRAGAAVVGGDISGAEVIVLTATALGLMPSGVAPVRRSGARVGDLVALAGVCGPSAAGLALLQAGFGGEVDQTGDSTRKNSSDAAASASESSPLHGLLRAHRAPRPGYSAGEVAARAGATSMIDTSDGLTRDAARLAEASGVTLSIDTSALPRPTALEAAASVLVGEASAEATSADSTSAEPEQVNELVMQWLLAGGEDHALLATFPPGTALPLGFVAVGAVVTPRAEPVLADGVSPQVEGWRHWRDG